MDVWFYLHLFSNISIQTAINANVLPSKVQVMHKRSKNIIQMLLYVILCLCIMVCIYD